MIQIELNDARWTFCKMTNIHKSAETPFNECFQKFYERRNEMADHSYIVKMFNLCDRLDHKYDHYLNI